MYLSSIQRNNTRQKRKSTNYNQIIYNHITVQPQWIIFIKMRKRLTFISNSKDKHNKTTNNNISSINRINNINNVNNKHLNIKHHNKITHINNNLTTSLPVKTNTIILHFKLFSGFNNLHLNLMGEIFSKDFRRAKGSTILILMF